MKKTLIAVSLTTLVLTSLFTGCEQKDKLSLRNKEKIEKIKLLKEKGDNINLDIYYDASEKGTIKVTKEERVVEKEELMGELILQELIKGPSIVSKLKPVLPKETRLRSFSIKDKIACVDFSKEANESLSKGKQEIFIKSLVLSLTQLPSVDKVKLLIEGKDVNMKVKDIDLSKPISKDDIMTTPN